MHKTYFVFTDSSTLNNGQKKKSSHPTHCSTAYHILGLKDPVSRSFTLGEMDINRAELIGIQKALKYLIDFKKLKDDRFIIVSDNNFSVQSLINWINTWIRTERNGTFYNSQNKPVANQDIIKDIYYNYVSKYDINIFHINSHIPNSGMVKFHEKFNKVNGTSVPFNTFKLFKLSNDVVDELAKEELLRYFKEYHDTKKLMIKF